ncbi:DNA/RNA non-specific endonuclease [Actinomadura sp. NPDC000600]|uniref:DNA/RNA non-specific endonuclease n=1 Tax=Actinomadura sp. NPDC000600 TaxID=3154262 RepID=UPI00339B38F4
MGAADILGGDGRGAYKRQNLFTCLQEPTNNSYMKPWEVMVRGAVKEKGQIVDYRVSLICRGRQLRPAKIRMQADGKTRNGMPGIFFGRCITTRVNGRDKINRGSC